MDYRDHFAHLLQHMVREIPAECERRCPVRYYKDGSTTWSGDGEGSYSGPSLEHLFPAMREMGYVAEIRILPPMPEYFPTTLGIEYLENHRYPLIRHLWKGQMPMTTALSVPKKGTHFLIALRGVGCAT